MRNLRSIASRLAESVRLKRRRASQKHIDVEATSEAHDAQTESDARAKAADNPAEQGGEG